MNCTAVQTYSNNKPFVRVWPFFRTGAVVLLMVLPILLCPAQDTLRARKYLQHLASPQFHGRGYLQNGANKAARYLANAFRKMGLKPIKNSYYQQFTFRQNLFPNDPVFDVEGHKLKPGIDFLPSPDCPPVSGQFKTFLADSLFLLSIKSGGRQCQNEAWVETPYAVRNKKNHPEWNPGLWIQPTTKLTHSLASQQAAIPKMVMIHSALPKFGEWVTCRVLPRLDRNVESSNVMAYVAGTTHPDSFLVVCGHYDHLGRMGKSIFFPGANDNASGSAMVLELAARFSAVPCRYSVLFIAFSGEEAGLVGSRFFVENSPIPLSKIKFVLNMDLMGFGDLGATVVNATVYPDQFTRLMAIQAEKRYLPEIKARGKAANSDHYYFSEAGVPAFFIYTLGGPGFYHDIWDKPESVSFSGFIPTFNLLEAFLRGF